jgi:hypothetical protein
MHLPHRPVVAGLAACTVLAVASPAFATDFCVNPPAGCAGTPVTAAGLSAALTGAQANGTDDRFFLAPGTYAAPAFVHQSAERLQLVGAGAGRTILVGGGPGGSVLTLGGNAQSAVSGLTLRATGTSGGLTLDGGQAADVAVEVTGGGGGVALAGNAGFVRGTIDVPGAGQSGVVVFAGSPIVSDSTVRVPQGRAVAAADGAVTVRRSTLAAQTGAVATGGRLAISDSLVDVRGQAPGTGVIASTSLGGSLHSTADLDRVTIVGSAPDSIGVAVEAAGPDRTATVAVRDSVISGLGVPIDRQAGPGATATVTTDHSAYHRVEDPSHDAGAGGIVETQLVDADPHFVDAPYGDFHLAAGSPLIDAGTPGAPPAGTLDRDGHPRPADGNGDCVAVSDIGAFEFAGGPCAPAAPAPAVAPAPPAAAPAPAKPVVSRLKVAGAVVSFRLSEAATVRLRFTHRAVTTRLRRAGRRGVNRIRLRGKLRRPGAYRLTVVAVDRAGARSRPATARFTVAGPRRGR